MKSRETFRRSPFARFAIRTVVHAGFAIGSMHTLPYSDPIGSHGYRLDTSILSPPSINIYSLLTANGAMGTVLLTVSARTHDIHPVPHAVG